MRYPMSIRTIKPVPAAILASSLALAALLTGACSAAFLDSADVSRAKDTVPPTVSISTPGEGSSCANIVEVTGVTADLAAPSGAAGKVVSITYSVPGSAVSGTVTPGSGGSFSFQFETVTLGSSFLLTVTARDWNGNEGVSSVNLRKTEGNEVPSFAAAASNKSVTLTWNPVPDTESYTLYYSSNGALPSETVGTVLANVRSPYKLACENGKLYTFRLKANAKEGWSDSESDFVRSIPLSEMTLLPRAYPKRGKIRLEWNSIEATDEFTVFRRVGETGSFTEYRTTTGTAFTDTGVQNGPCYYYSVRPSAHSGVLSRPAGTVTDGFNPSPSVERSSALTREKVEGVFASGKWLYGSSYENGLKVFDASDPRNPVLAASVAPPGGCVYQVLVEGNYAYTASGADGLVIYDVSNPAAPSLAGSYSAGIERGCSLAIAGSYVLLTDFSIESVSPSTMTYDCALSVINVSDPSAPTLEARYTIDSGAPVAASEISGLTYMARIAVAGNYAYIAEYQRGLRIVEWTYGGSPADGAGLVATVQANPASPLSSQTSGVALYGNYAYAASYTYGLMVVDVADPTAPVIVSSDTSSGRVSDVCVENGWLYASNIEAGVQLYRLDDPSAPELQRTMTGEYFWRISTGANFAFAYGGLSYMGTVGIYAADLNLPLFVRELSEIPSKGHALDVSAEGSRLCVADGGAGLRVFDCSDPAAPSESSSVLLSGYSAFQVRQQGGYAFVLWEDTADASPLMSFGIYDLSNPAAPATVSVMQYLSYVRDFAVSGDYLYMSNLYNGIEIYDISNPAKPALAKSVDAPPTIYGITVAGNYALVADNVLGASVYDISSPLQTYLVSTVTMTDLMYLFADGNQLYGASNIKGLFVADIAEPEFPGTATNFPFDPDPMIPAHAGEVGKDIKGSGNYAYALTRGNTLLDSTQHYLTVLDVNRPGSSQKIARIKLSLLQAPVLDYGIDLSGPLLFESAGSKVTVYSLRP